MERLKIRVCTGKRCVAHGAEKLLEVVEDWASDERTAVKIKEVGCLGHCGKKKRGLPPFVEVGDELVAGATLEAVRATRNRPVSDEVRKHHAPS